MPKSAKAPATTRAMGSSTMRPASRMRVWTFGEALSSLPFTPLPRDSGAGYSQQTFSRWIPAILRRIEKDAGVQDALHSALTSTAVPSIKVSFGSLLASAAGVDERLRTFVASELQRVDAEARGR